MYYICSVYKTCLVAVSVLRICVPCWIFFFLHIVKCYPALNNIIPTGYSTFTQFSCTCTYNIRHNNAAIYAVISCTLPWLTRVFSMLMPMIRLQFSCMSLIILSDMHFSVIFLRLCFLREKCAAPWLRSSVTHLTDQCIPVITHFCHHI